jgi:DNA-binding MarR family transcriptional regulator
MGNSSRPDNNVNTHQMIVMISIVYNAMQKLIRREIRKLGLTPEQGAALMGIYVLGNNTTAAELSRYSLREPASTTIILKRLEKQGLISRSDDAHRKNISRISLTDKGYKYYQKALNIKSLDRVLSKLTEQHKSDLWQVQDEFRRHAFKELNIDVDSYSKFLEKLLNLD